MTPVRFHTVLALLKQTASLTEEDSGRFLVDFPGCQPELLDMAVREAHGLRSSCRSRDGLEEVEVELGSGCFATFAGRPR